MKRDEFADVALPKGGFGIEIGVDDGVFSLTLLDKASPSRLVLLDCWNHQNGPDDPGATFDQGTCEIKYQNVLKLFKDDSRVDIVRATSPGCVSLFQDSTFDWIYLDANHSYKSVSEDLLAWYPKLKPGGVFSGHDYVNENYGLQAKKAVDEFIAGIGVSLSFVSDEKYPDWAFVKPNGAVT